jgi:hypothetical protein
VLAHVRDCEVCRVHLNELRQVSLRLAQGTAEASTTAGVGATAAIAEEAPAAWKRELALMPRWLWVAAPVAAVVMIAFAMNQRQRISGDVTPAAAGAELAADKDRLKPAGDVPARPPAPTSARHPAPTTRAPIDPLVARDPRQAAQVGQAGVDAGGSVSGQQGPDAPMIVRTVDLALMTDRFADVAPSLDRLLATVQGSMTSLTLGADEPPHRTLDATLRVPAARLDAALTGLRLLGRVQRESQSGEDVGSAHRDLTIRLANARKEEARLTAQLAVEPQVTHIRAEIEQLDSEEQAMRGQVALSTITLHIGESDHAGPRASARGQHSRRGRP